MNRLPREFIWKDVESIDNFLHDPLNKELYEVYKTVKDTPFKITIPDVKVFNELYYLCACLKFGDIICLDLEEMILADLGHRYAPSLLISMIYAVYCCQDIEIRKELKIGLGSFYHQHGGWYFKTFYDFAINHGMFYKTNFSPMPEKASNIVKRDYSWERITHSYNTNVLLRVISLWRKDEEKLTILDAIESAYKKDSNKESLIRKSDSTLILPSEIDFQKFRETIIKHKEISLPVVYDNEISDFASYVINKDHATDVVRLLHQYIDGKKKPQAASIPIRAAIDAKVLHKPTWEIYKEEFPNCTNSRTSFERYSGASFDTQAAFKGKDVYEEMVAAFKAI